MESKVTVPSDEIIELEPWDDKCYMCGKQFETGDSYRFISFDDGTRILDQTCENTLKVIIQEYRREHGL